MTWRLNKSWTRQCARKLAHAITMLLIRIILKEFQVSSAVPTMNIPYFLSRHTTIIKEFSINKPKTITTLQRSGHSSFGPQIEMKVSQALQNVLPIGNKRHRMTPQSIWKRFSSLNFPTKQIVKSGGHPRVSLMICCTWSSTPTLRTFLSVQACVNQVYSTTAGPSLKAIQIKLAWRNSRTTSTKEQTTTLQRPWALDSSASTCSCSISVCTVDPREWIL